MVPKSGRDGGLKTYSGTGEDDWAKIGNEEMDHLSEGSISLVHQKDHQRCQGHTQMKCFQPNLHQINNF